MKILKIPTTFLQRNCFNLESWYPGSFKFQILNSSLEVLLKCNLNLTQNCPFSPSSLFSRWPFLLSFQAVMDTFTAHCTHKPGSVQSIMVQLTEQPEGRMSVTGPDAVWRPIFSFTTLLGWASKSFKIAAQGIKAANVFMHVKYTLANVTHLSCCFFLCDTTRQDTAKIKRL